VQDYTYEGQSGWRALGNSITDYVQHDYNDQMQKVYQSDPNFYTGPK
jgi:hypothetical protein